MGGWKCKDGFVADEMNLSKNRVAEARVGLKKKGWVRDMGDYFIVPVFGFRLVENSTDLVENPTDLVENSTNPFKGITSPINQPIKPVQLTSSSAESAKREFASERENKNCLKNSSEKDDLSFAKADAKSRNGGGNNKQNGLSPDRAATKPKDQRIRHPAIRMVREISGRFPHKDLWNRVIREIGDNPDTEFFRASWEIWRSFDGKPTNYEKWLFEPNNRGKPPEVFAGTNGKSAQLVEFPKPAEVCETLQEQETPLPLDEKAKSFALEVLRDIAALGGRVSEWEQYYTPEDWKFLMEELSNAGDP